MNFRDPFDLADLALEDYYAGRADPPPGHPDYYEELQQEEDYLRRYSDAPVTPVRVSDDWHPEDLDELAEAA